MTSLVDEEVARFHEKLSAEGVYLAMHDAQYTAEWYSFTHLLGIVDAAMESAGLMVDTRRGILQHVLAGSPDEGAAIRRIRESQEQVRHLARTPPLPLFPPVTPWPRAETTAPINWQW